MKSPFVQNPVNQLMRDAATGKSSRRELIRRGSALGLSGALMGTILGASKMAAQDATPEEAMPMGYTLVAPEWLTADYSGVELNVVLGADGTGAPMDQAMCDLFATTTGATVNYIKGAESATDRLTFYTQTLNSESSDIDVAQVDVIWPGIIARHAVDLAEQATQLAETGATFFERILNNNTIDGTTVSLPWFTDAGLLYYRTDLAEKYGYAEAPKTWMELQEQAQAIMDGEVAENDAFTGFTFQAKAYEGLTCNALEWIVSNDGGNIIEEDGTVTVDSEGAVAAIEMAKGWVGTIAPEAVTGYMEEDSRNIWQGGNAAFHRNWPYAFSLGEAADSVIKDKFAISVLPAGEGGNNAATLGGWNAFVSKYSENVDAAKDFAKFMVSKEVQRSRAIERSSNPTIRELYEDPDVIAANPFMKDLFDTFDGGAVARPSNVAKDLYNDVSIAVFTKVNEILTGQHDDTAAALGDLKSELESIMEEV